MKYLAIDIGGANLKLADGRGYARSQPFAMWRQHQQLADALRVAIAEAPTWDELAVTMTGELADCFPSKLEGVRFILEAVEQAAGTADLEVYLVDGRLVSLAQARAVLPLAAAANWRALAQFALRLVGDHPALLLDIGSTTTDIVPLLGGHVASRSATDLDRLVAGELVYTGIERSPVCALVSTLPYLGQPCPIAQEVFATMRDVYLLLGHLPEDPLDRDTADHQPATIAAAHRRLARMVCADTDQVPRDVAQHWARQIADTQCRLVEDALRTVMGRPGQLPDKIVVAGHGMAIAHKVLQRLNWSGDVVRLDEQLGRAISRCATAHAVAVLAHERALAQFEDLDAT